MADGDVPAVAGLTGAWPNPFNPRVTLSYALPAAGAARLAVFDLRGREVAVLRRRRAAPRASTARGTAVTTAGARRPPGVYLAVLRTAQGTTTRKLVLAK